MAKKYGMIHDENLCIGCQACSIACRSENNIPDGVYRLQVWVQGPKRLNDGSLSFNYHRQSCVQCDNTLCVTVCPTDTLTFGDINNPNSPIRKKLARKVSVRPKESLGTQPKLHIIPNKRGGIES